MEKAEKEPSKSLREARSAFKEKNYSLSLKKYQWFYENSIKIDQSFYGVRLSYCLGEWAELGKVFPPAQVALVKLKNNTLATFKDTYSKSSFHEYSSISGYLNNSIEVYQEFLIIHKSDKELAKCLFTYVYKYCAENGHWDICYEYFESGYNTYDSTLEMFDHLIKFSNTKQSTSIKKDAIETIEREILWLLNTLYYGNAKEKYEEILDKTKKDLKKRGFDEIYDSIYSKAPSTNLT